MIANLEFIWYFPLHLDGRIGRATVPPAPVKLRNAPEPRLRKKNCGAPTVALTIVFQSSAFCSAITGMQAT
jgi:hypothetical protein